jgi:putative hydrolase of HD superfamily
VIERLLEAMALKDLDRAGWVRAGVHRPESVAAHSWGVAFLTLILLPKGLDRGKALSYAILHDLAEVRVGDIMPSDGISPRDKAQREAEAMTSFCEALPTDLVEAWRAYEAQDDPEARFVRQLDRFDMALQAQVYERQGLDLTEFKDSAASVIEDASLRALLRILRA